MNLTELITKLTEIEHRHIGHLVNVEIRDEAGVLTSDIKLTTEIVFLGNDRITVRIEPNDLAGTNQ